MTQQFENNANEMKRYAELIDRVKSQTKSEDDTPDHQEAAAARAMDKMAMSGASQGDLDTVKRQLIETQQTLIKLVDAMKKQQEQINALVKWAQENSDDVSPGGIIRTS